MSLHAPFKRRARLPKSVRWSAQAASPALRVTAHSMLHRALSGAGGRITKLLDPAFLLTPQWAYIFKSVASAALAYLVAYVLQLETPYSAASTVLLVTHMNQGVVLAKGSWRLIGTMIGGLVAILLMGLFIQAPSLFLISFGVWLGLCSMAATVLRHFRAVGAAVAGYTVGFATYGALEMPEHALNVVLGRTATVAVGVACLGLVTALFSKRATRERLEAAIAHQINNVGKLVLDRVSREHSADASPDLVAGSFAIDDLLELSRSESPEVAICADAVREGLASLFGATLGAMEIAFGATFNQPAVVAAREQISSHLPDAMRLVESGQESQVKKALATVAQLRHRLNAIAKDSEANGTDPQVLVTLDLLSEIVADWEGAVIGLVRLYNGRAHHSPDFRFHRDWEGGTRNAIRSVIGIVSGGAFGIATGWHDWSLLLLLLAPYSVILATTGNPTAGAVSFVKGTAAAAIPAFICAFFILPEIQGFPFLIIVMVPFWIAGLYATTIPRYTFAGLAYLVAFNTFISATNPMTFDMPGYFNKVLGWMIAVIATWLVLKLVLPHDPHRQADRIANALKRDIANAIAGRVTGRRQVWEHLQHHRLAAIALSLKGDASYAALMLTRGLGALHLGRTALRVWNVIHAPGTGERVKGIALEALAVASEPRQDARAQLSALGKRIAALDSDHADGRATCHLIASCIFDMEQLIERHGEWISIKHRRNK